MKKIIISFLIISFTGLFALAESTEKKILKYSGVNSKALIKMIKELSGKKLEYAEFLLDNSSPDDLAVLTPEYITESVDYAMKTADIPYTSQYDEEIFKHFVLPLRSSQEPFENWRKSFYEELYPLVKNSVDIEESAIEINFWCYEHMTYKSTHGRDQGPLTTIKRGWGRCEEMMIFYIAAARSVGIPVRSAGAPFWNFTDNNHAWVEVWTPEGWKYIGELANRLNKTWFSHTTQRASVITSRAFGEYKDKNVIKTENNCTTLSSIEYYTDKYDRCKIMVDDENGQPVEDAKITLYAVSYGGLIPMLDVATDKFGTVNIPLGKGTLFLTAFSNDKFAYNVFNTLENDPEINLILKENNTEIDTLLNYKFQIYNSDFEHDKKEKEYFKDTFDLRNQLVDQKRKNKFKNYERTSDFVEYFQKSTKGKIDNDYFKEQKEYLEKCNTLGENTSEFLKVYVGLGTNKLKRKILTEMIKNWDEKELNEIPDSAAIKDIVDIYYSGRNKYFKIVSDSIFSKDVIGSTWRSATPPQNGWQKEFYDKIKDLQSYNINTTVKDVIYWVDSKVAVDSNFTYSYYSGALNPLQILNMRSVPDFHRIKLLNSALKLLGVPVHWKGRLEYYNGKEFLPVEKPSGKNKVPDDRSLRLSLYVDGEKIKADPWSNFILTEFNEGVLEYTYFDGSNDSLDYILTFPDAKEKKLYIESAVRNINGDANIIIKTLDPAVQDITVELNTPKEYIDTSSDFTELDKKNIKEVINSETDADFKIILVRGVIPTEPSKRMLDLLVNKIFEIGELNTKLIIYTEIRDNEDIKGIEDKSIIKKSGKILIPETDDESYPVIILTDKSNKIIFSSKGYNMSIADLLIKKIKNIKK